MGKTKPTNISADRLWFFHYFLLYQILRDINSLECWFRKQHRYFAIQHFVNDNVIMLNVPLVIRRVIEERSQLIDVASGDIKNCRSLVSANEDKSLIGTIGNLLKTACSISKPVLFVFTFRIHFRRYDWEDGEKFEIDRVLDIRQAAAMKAGGQGDRYTIMVHGKQSYLFFERSTNLTGNNIGRWFVERRTQ